MFRRVPNVSTGSNIYIVANSVNDFCINKKRISPLIRIDNKAIDAYRNGYKCADLVVRYQTTTFGDESGINLYIEGAIDQNVANSLILDNSTDEEAEIIPGKENDRYSDVETCTDVDVNHIKACGCIPAEVADITSKALLSFLFT